MPEPIPIIKRHQRHSFESDLNSTLSNLRRVTEYIYHGVEYEIDYDEYDIRINEDEIDYNNARNEYNNGEITDEIFDEIADEYFTSISTYYLIDVDGKKCGTFNTHTREYYMFLRRIKINEIIYYVDYDGILENYDGIEIGRLLDDGTIAEL
jgi:hypothetical protein